jgi:xanthine dehydrogenase accessory factor
VFQLSDFIFPIFKIMDIFKETIDALEHEDRVMLATIISTSGSTPASALSKMLVKNNCSSLIGTVGGGCMEADVAEHAKIIYPEKTAKIVSYRLVEDGIEQGLICGGTLTILIEPVVKENIPLFNRLRTLRDEGEDCVLATILSDGGKSVEKAIVAHPDASNRFPKTVETLTSDEFKVELKSLDVNIEDIVRKVYNRGETEYLKTESFELILEPILGKPSLIIFGGGHVSKFVSRTAAMAGFGVTVVDDREMFANAKRFPEAEKTIAVDFENAFEHVAVKQSTYIVIVTRGHRYDEVVLEQAVKTPAKYIGMIGSKRKVFTTYEHLVERGTPVHVLKNVYSPMGLDIGAVTAEEIAVSIVSEMIKVRRGKNEEITHKSDPMKPLFYKLEK